MNALKTQRGSLRSLRLKAFDAKAAMETTL
jgi:hypothetical protein